MKILSIGSDRKLFEDGSAVSERIKEYGKLVEEYHVIVFAQKSLNLKEKKLGENVWIYPSNSSSRWFYVFDAARIGKRVVFDKKFVRGNALITTQDPFESGWAGLKVKKKWRLPLEVQIHTDPNSPYFRGFLNTIRKIIAKRVLANADSIRDVKTFPIYVDRARIENQKPSFDLHSRHAWPFIMLSVSRLAPEKNLGMALLVLSLIRVHSPNAGLIIVGSGPEEGRLKALSKKLKLEGAVEFVGWQDDLASYYKTANVFIQTSLFEGYGLSLIEAGLSGLPVVTTPVGIARELKHGEEAYIYPADRPDLMAAGVEELIGNNFKRENLRINLRRTLESKLLSKEDYMAKMKTNWDKIAARVK